MIRPENEEEILGLNHSQVKERLRKGLNNERVDPRTRSSKEIIKSNIFTYFNLIFVILGLLLVLVGSFKDLSFLIIVVINTAVGIVQELRSKNILDKMRFLYMPNTKVMRDGTVTDVPTEQLVLDDIVILSAGNQVPADAVVVEGRAEVNEAMLTGEEDEINKDRGDELLSGSFVVSGECKARLTAVGRASYISKLTLEATKNDTENKPEMIKSLDRLVMVIGIIIIPVGLILFFQEYKILNYSFHNSVTSMVAAVLGMVPEGLYMTATIALVVSAVRLASRKVLVQNMRSIEALARVDVLCVDKTGTITETDMAVSGTTVIAEGMSREEAAGLIGDIVEYHTNDNATMAALKEEFSSPAGRTAVNISRFSSKYKYSSTSFTDGSYAIGAPEYVLGDRFRDYARYISEMSDSGYRVLAVVETEQEPGGGELRGRTYPIALIFLVNPVRENAKETFDFFAKNGVEIKVISGDNPETVSRVAMEAGIPGGDHYLDARQLSNERAIYDAVQRYTVFGRVTPDQKKMFIHALQKLGKTVGMTGDGVNDVMALRDADCSVAMASGSEAASSAAQLVLLDSDFSHMPSVVSEGRRVVNNLIKAASLYLTKNIFSFLLAVFSMINVLKYPLKPSQITLISAFTIGIPSFILSLEPNKSRIEGKFLTNVFKMAAPAGLTMFISVSALVVFGQVFNISDSCISTSATMLVALVGFLFLGKVAMPTQIYHVVMITTLIGGMAACILFAPSLFGIDSITREAAMLLIVFLIATEGLFRYIHKIVDFFARLGKDKAGRKQKGVGNEDS